MRMISLIVALYQTTHWICIHSASGCFPRIPTPSVKTTLTTMDSQPSVKELNKQTFKCYQFIHHQKNWLKCPPSIVSRVDKIVDNINLPQTEYEEYIDTNGALIYEANKFIGKITEICQRHTSRTPLFPFEKFTAHQVFIALIVTKKRAKNTYRKINHDHIKDICQMFNKLAPKKFLFHYVNKLIVDDSCEVNSDSEDNSINLDASDLSDTAQFESETVVG